MNEPSSSTTKRASPSRRTLLGPLVASLIALISCFIVRSLETEPQGRDSIDTRPGTSSPTREDVLALLRSESDAPTILSDDTGQPQPFGSVPGRIDSLTIDRKDGSWVAARFRFTTAHGSYAIEAILDHHPSDGSFVFDRLRIGKVDRL